MALVFEVGDNQSIKSNFLALLLCLSPAILINPPLTSMLLAQYCYIRRLFSPPYVSPRSLWGLTTEAEKLPNLTQTYSNRQNFPSIE